MTRVIRPGCDEWPDRLNELGPHEAPARLFATGIEIDATMPMVAVVGTRRPTAAGVEAAISMARGLAEAGFVVVSGMAVGIDAAAHEAALRAGGPTIAVLGCGLDVRYPRRNLGLRDRIVERGTLLTEYPEGTPPQKAYFPRRNRIIAGLSLGVVVIEGAITSGALVTARLALDANRHVFAVPGSVRNPMSEGPNELIRTGQASLATRVEHVFEELAPQLAWTHPTTTRRGEVVDLDDEEARVLRHLDDAPVEPDLIARSLDLRPGRLAVLLSKLEVRGLATRTRGGYVISGAGARQRGAECANTVE